MNETLTLDSTYNGQKAFAVWMNRDTGQAWNGSAFTTYSAANLVAGATSQTFDFRGYIAFAVPGSVAAVTYDVTVYPQAGASPATSDLTSEPLNGAGGAIYLGPIQANNNTGQTTAIPATVSGGATAASQTTIINQTTAGAIAAAVLATPADKLATDGQGRVTTANPAVAAAGSGAQPCTLTLTENNAPVIGANVWITTDSAGLIPIAGVVVSNNLGEAIVPLVAGNTYYLWATNTGGNPISGQSFVAIADT